MLLGSGMGFASLALSQLIAGDRLLASEAGSPSGETVVLHHPPRAKAVIMLMQNGGPSQMELFDPKPALQRHAGTVYRDKVEMFQPGSEGNMLLPCPFKFHARGQCGTQMSEALPHLGAIADDLCLVRSMRGEHNNHTESLVMITSGKILPGRPTLGAWVSYALGSENENLPAYVVLRDPEGYPGTGATLWQNGWLSPNHRGTEFNTKGEPVLNLQSASALPAGAETDDLEFLAKLNRQHQRDYPHDSVLESRIRNYELAARMQLAAGGVLELARESESARRMYGLDNPVTAPYGTRLLMARRLIESGVRFVQVFCGVGNPWDSHKDVKGEIEGIAAKTDLPSAALIRDLKQRGLLDSTIVLWTGEFGRLPVSQHSKGRDHNRNGFSLLLAGGGFKSGIAYGQTDDVGYRAVEKPVSVPDLFATILHQLGLDHRRLTYFHHGREESLTDPAVSKAHVVTDLLDHPVNV